MCFGEPIRVDADPGDEEAMTAAYHEIVDTMQSMMDELTEGRTPVIGR
jgi:hypothetical protein